MQGAAIPLARRALEASGSTDLTALSAARVDALRALGFVYLQSGLFAKARILFSALHELWPADVQIAASLAYALLHEGRFDAALALLDGCQHDAVPPPPLCDLLRARALSGLGRTDEARAALLVFSQSKGSR